MNDITDFFNSRRTVRRYTERQVPDELLDSLIEAATHAPTTGNMQLYSVVVTRDNDMKHRLAPTHFNQPSVTGASAVLTFCADFNRFERWCEERNASPGFENFQSWMTAVLDTTIFAQQFCTLAEMHGLGCCYLGTTTYNAPQIAEILSLPRRVVPVTTLTVGYPDGEAPVSDRLPACAIIHRERYCDYTAEAIDSAYAYKEALPESARYIAENGKSTLAQVFTDIRYPKAGNETFSQVYIDLLKHNGYMQ